MDESLVSNWLDEEVEDITKALALYGVMGILQRFEDWLRLNDRIKERKTKHGEK